MSYLIKTFRGGISDETDKGVSGAFKHGHALNIHGRDDVLTSNQGMATIDGGLVTDLIQFFIPAQDGSTYCFGHTGSIYVRSGDGAWNFAYNDENGAIKGASEWELSDGNNYLFWATNTSIARAALNGSLAVPWAAGVATQNFKTTLNSTDWHTMKPASGSLMIANGESVATIAFDGSFDVNDLNIRPGNIIKALEERDDYVILGTGRGDAKEEANIFSWITIANNWVQKKMIPVQRINAIINAEQMLLQGGDDGELYYSDFTNAIPLHAVPGGGQIQPGGIAIEEDLVVMGFFGGTYPGIWSYGRSKKNRPYALNYEYRLSGTVSGSSISTIGAVAVIDSTLIASWGTTDGSTSDYGVDSVSSTTKANAIYEGLEFDGERPDLTKYFQAIKIIMDELPSGTSVSAKFRTNRQSSWQYAALSDGGTTFSTSGETAAIFSAGVQGKIFEVGAELNASSNTAPTIHAISTFLNDEPYDYA